MTEEQRLETGYAALKTDSDDVPIQVSGVAIGEGDITVGGSGKETYWPRETLEAKAEALEGQPIATSKNHTTEGTQPQTPSDAVVGEVTWSGYKPGVGVVYEGEVDDPDIARSVENNRLEVSPLVSREIEPMESDKADFKATKINGWRDLATVWDGAAPSNEITVGENPMKAEALHATVEALQSDLTPPEQAQENAQQVLEWREEHGDEVDAMTETGWTRAKQLASGEELSPEVVKKMAQFNRHRSNKDIADEYEGEPWKDNGHVAWLGWGGDAGVDWAIEQSDEMESMAESSTLENAEALKEVAGVEFTGTADGKLDESEIEDNYGDHALYGSGENKGDYSYWVVDADGNLRRGNVESAWSLGCRGQCPSDESHDEKLMQLNEEFDDPPIDTDTESMGSDVADPEHWEACSVSLPENVTQHDDGTQGGRSQSSVADDSNEDTMTDELTETETAVLEAADSVDEPVEALEEFAATEQPEVVNGEQYESLQENVTEVRDVLSEALSEKTELKESTIEALGFEALCDEFRDDEGELQVEALRQQPETEEPEEPNESGVEALSDDADMDKAEALYEDMQSFGVDHEETIVEALGVEDFDEATEVLD